MKNLNMLFNECINECKKAGIPYGTIKEVGINTRAKSRWGQCRYMNGVYSINISSILLEDDVTDVATKTTIIHEIIHTCKDCMNHGAEWKKYAEIMNRKYGYNIKRCTSADEKHISIEIAKPKYKYTVVCEKCGTKSNYTKLSKLVKLIKSNPHDSGCRCLRCGNDTFSLISY